MATTENGTYYPSDYSSVADVPSDMKKMAESIDANKVQKIKGKGLSTKDFTGEYEQKLEDLENYDDTEVKEDISDIKEEQTAQDKNIEDLQKNDEAQEELILKLEQENKNIKSALINVETEQAKSLHIEDASTAPAQLSVEGNAEQGGEPSPSNPVSIKCLGSNKNIYPGWEHGTISSDTGNNAYDPRYIRSIDFISVFPNKEYTIKAYNIENINQLNTAIRMYDSNKEYLEDLYVGMIHVDSKTFIITNENVKYIKIVSSNNSAITETSKVDIKLEEGEVATSYSPYEQGSTEIIKSNKNMLCKPKNSIVTGRGLTVNYSEGKFIINGTTTADTYIKLDKELKADVLQNTGLWSNSVLNPGSYMFSIKTISGTSSSTNVNLYIRDTAGSGYILDRGILQVSQIGTKNNRFSIDKQYNYLCYLWVPASTTFDNFTFSVMLEEGTELTEFEENEQNSYILPIQQEMLNGDYFELEADGWKEVHIWSKIRFLNQDFKKSTKTEVTRYFVANIVNIVEDRNNTVVLSEHFLGIPSVQNDNNELGISNYNDNGFLINIDKADTNFDTLEKFETFLQNNEVYAYYKTTTPTKLACTEEQSAVLDKLNNLDLFRPTVNIITTEDIALLKLKYVVDTKTYVDNQIADMQNQLNTINELLSTTATSSILLDNLQTDLESEVM